MDFIEIFMHLALTTATTKQRDCGFGSSPNVSAVIMPHWKKKVHFEAVTRAQGFTLAVAAAPSSPLQPVSRRDFLVFSITTVNGTFLDQRWPRSYFGGRFLGKPLACSEKGKKRKFKNQG
jgi:hypothetical protein